MKKRTEQKKMEINVDIEQLKVWKKAGLRARLRWAESMMDFARKIS
jgi:hypothetical protein